MTTVAPFFRAVPFVVLAVACSATSPDASSSTTSPEASACGQTLPALCGSAVAGSTYDVACRAGAQRPDEIATWGTPCSAYPSMRLLVHKTAGFVVVVDAGIDDETDFYFDAASGKLTGVTHSVASPTAHTSCVAGGSDFRWVSDLQRQDVEINLCCPSATASNHYVCE